MWIKGKSNNIDDFSKPNTDGKKQFRGVYSIIFTKLKNKIMCFLDIHTYIIKNWNITRKLWQNSRLSHFGASKERQEDTSGGEVQK